MKITGKHKRDRFVDIIQRLEKQNAIAIWSKAVIANKIAKIASGQSQRRAYNIKDQALSDLIKLGYVTLNSVTFQPNVILGLDFREGGCLHAIPGALKPETEPIVMNQAISIWTRGRDPLSANSEEKHSNQNEIKYSAA